MQIEFLKASSNVLADFEVKDYIEFELLDYTLDPYEITDGEKDRRRRKRKRIFPPKDFQVDWELGGFIDCMKECEKDVSGGKSGCMLGVLENA